MKKNEELVWRLQELPDASGVAELVAEKIITPEQARHILFKQEEPKQIKALQEEVKFLRELVDKLTDQKSIQVVRETYREYVPSYPQWYRRYEPVLLANATPHAYTITSGSLNVGASGNVVNASSLNTTTTSTNTIPKLSSLNQ